MVNVYIYAVASYNLNDYLCSPKFMKWQIADLNRVKINYEFGLSLVGSSGSRLVKPVRVKGLTSVADTHQTFKRPRKELTDGTYHKGKTVISQNWGHLQHCTRLTIYI